jgi:hypothetical protein
MLFLELGRTFGQRFQSFQYVATTSASPAQVATEATRRLTLGPTPVAAPQGSLPVQASPKSEAE